MKPFHAWTGDIAAGRAKAAPTDCAHNWKYQINSDLKICAKCGVGVSGLEILQLGEAEAVRQSTKRFIFINGAPIESVGKE